MKRLVLLSLACLGLLVPVSSASAAFSFQTTTLEPPAGEQVEDVAVGDLDGINGPDLVTAYEGGGLGVQLNDGHGHFGAPHVYPTGCRVSQVELADVGAPPDSIKPDGHLDAVFACVFNGGDTIELGRMFGDGSGGLSEPVLFPESSYGFDNGLAASHQSFALVDFRGPTGPPVPAWSYLEGGFGGFHRFLCLSFDWSTRQCTDSEEPGAPFVAGEVAEAELFTLGGSEGLLDWGFHPEERASTRDFGPLPKEAASGDTAFSIAIGDLQGDGPDIFTSAGTSGGVPEEPATGRISVLYGNAGGVPVQHATTFPSAPGVEGINSGDFDLDGHTDIVGTSWSYSPAAGGVGTVFFQAGNGAGQLGNPQEIPLYKGERFDVNPPQVADLDGNGTADVVAVVGGKVQVMLNQTAPPAAPTGTPGSTGTKAPPPGANPLAGIKNLPKSTNALANGLIQLGTATNPPTAGVTITITVPPFKKAKGSSVLALTRKGGAKPTVIGKAHITVPAGKTVPLKVKLSSMALGQLKKGALHAHLSIVAVSAGGTTKSTTKPVTIKPPAQKKGDKK